MGEKLSWNIGMVAGSMPPMRCGVGDNALMLARALAERGHHVTIYTHIEADALQEHNLTVRPIVNSWSVAGCAALTLALQLDDPDLVHIQYPTVAYGKSLGPVLLPMNLKIRRYKGPVITQLHEYARAHWLRKLATHLLTDRSDGVLQPSGVEHGAILREHRSLNDRPLGVVPVGPVVFPGDAPAATQSEWEASLAGWGVPNDAFPLLISYGFLRHDKGIQTLAEALAKLPAASKAHVLHIGPWDPVNDPRTEKVLDLISDAGAIGRFHPAGYQPLRLLPATPPKGIAGIFPYTDGLSDRRSAAITLGALGYPILGTAPADAAQAARWREQAILVPASNPEALCAAIQDLAAKDWPSSLREQFAARYGWDHLAAEVEEFYADVLTRYQVLTDPGYVPAANATLADAHGHH